MVNFYFRVWSLIRLGHIMSEADEGDSAAASISVATVDKLSGYLRKIVPLLIDDGESETSALDRALKDKNGVEAQRKFLAEPQIRRVGKNYGLVYIWPSQLTIKYPIVSAQINLLHLRHFFNYESFLDNFYIEIFFCWTGLFWLAVTASTRKRKKGTALKAPWQPPVRFDTY